MVEKVTRVTKDSMPGKRNGEDLLHTQVILGNKGRAPRKKVQITVKILHDARGMREDRGEKTCSFVGTRVGGPGKTKEG